MQGAPYYQLVHTRHFWLVFLNRYQTEQYENETSASLLYYTPSSVHSTLLLCTLLRITSFIRSINQSNDCADSPTYLHC